MEGDTWVIKMVAKTLRWTETGRETEIWRQKREREIDINRRYRHTEPVSETDRTEGDVERQRDT